MIHWHWRTTWYMTKCNCDHHAVQQHDCTHHFLPLQSDVCLNHTIGGSSLAVWRATVWRCCHMFIRFLVTISLSVLYELNREERNKTKLKTTSNINNSTNNHVITVKGICIDITIQETRQVFSLSCRWHPSASMYRESHNVKHQWPNNASPRININVNNDIKYLWQTNWLFDWRWLRCWPVALPASRFLTVAGGL